MEELPNLVLVKIFLKLPVKNVIRCSNVCKSWRKIVSEHPFDQEYVSSSGIIDLQFHTKLLSWIDMKNQTDVMNNNRTLMSLNLTSTPDFHGIKIFMESSVKGLVFLKEDVRYGVERYPDGFILNPVTKEFITLPKDDDNQSICLIDDDVVYGFGFDDISKTFKVLKVTNRKKVFVYTLGGIRFWKSISDLELGVRLDHRSMGINLNNKSHFLSIGSDPFLRVPHRISCFDWNTEVFQSVPSTPDNILEKQDFRHKVVLAVIHNCLCESYTSINNLSIWMMKIYGVVESWMRFMMVTHSEISRAPAAVFAVTSFHVIKSLDDDGTLLIKLSSGAPLLYNPGRTAESVIVHKGSWWDALDFSPSFLRLQSIVPDATSKVITNSLFPLLY